LSKAVPLTMLICSDGFTEIRSPEITHGTIYVLFSYGTLYFRGPGQRSRYSDPLRAGRSGIGSQRGARLTPTVQTGLGAHPACCTMGTWSLFWR